MNEKAGRESEKGKQELFSAEIYVEVVNDFIKDWFDEFKKFDSWAKKYKESEPEKSLLYREKANLISEMLVDLKTRGF